MVDSPQEGNLAIRQEAAQVSCLVQASPGLIVEAVKDELFCGHKHCLQHPG